MATNKEFRDRAVSRGKIWCYYCGKELMAGEATTDHATPISKGGTGRRGNLRVACHDCNGLKDDKSVDEFLQELSQGLYLRKEA